MVRQNKKRGAIHFPVFLRLPRLLSESESEVLIVALLKPIFTNACSSYSRACRAKLAHATMHTLFTFTDTGR